MYKSLQKIAEEKIYDILFELENELEIETGKLPEVHYIAENSSFEKLCLREQDQYYFDWIKYSKTACCIPDKKLILTATLEDYVLAEEAAHSIHFQNVKDNTKTIIGEFFFGAICEMNGFFGSKLICPERQNPFSLKRDYFQNKKLPEIFTLIMNKRKKGRQEGEKLIYEYGYNMGENMFNKYILGELPKEKIRDIFTKKLNDKGEMICEFFKWKDYLIGKNFY